MNAKAPIGDMPTMFASAYTSQTMGGSVLASPWFDSQTAIDADLEHSIKAARAVDRLYALQQEANKKEEIMPRRLVQVIIMDPNESVPLDQCVLYNGSPFMTDLENQEIFFEMDIKPILDAYNAKRITFRNKAVKDREEKLEPARIRDLKMSVVEIANFK